MATVGSLAWQLIADNTRFAAGTAAARGNISGLRSDLVSLKGALTGAVGGAGFAALTAGVLASGAAVGAFIKEGVRMSATLEQLRVNLDVMTGSGEVGGALLGQMVSLAKETPFSLEDVAGAGKVLLAMGAAAGDVTRQVRMLGDVAAGTSQPVAQLAQVFGEVQQAGRLTSNELRQFNMRGIPLMAELSDMLGVTKVELRGMVEAGEVSADAVEQAFERMTSAGGRFADLMGKQAETLTGTWERFSDAVSLAASRAAGDPGTSGTLAGYLKSTLNVGDELAQRIEVFQSKGMRAFTQAGQQEFFTEQINKDFADQLALHKTKGTPIDELGPVDEELEKLNEKMGKFNDKLQLQVQTFGMAEEAAELYEFRQAGATQADLERAQVLIDQKNKLEEGAKLEKEAAKAKKEELADMKKLSKSLIDTPAEKFMEEFDDILKFSGTKTGSENTGLVSSLLDDLKDRVSKEINPAANIQSTSAIRAGSIEALRAQFPGGQVAAKQLKEAEKQTKEQESMRGLLETISDKIQGLAEAPG